MIWYEAWDTLIKVGFVSQTQLKKGTCESHRHFTHHSRWPMAQNKMYNSHKRLVPVFTVFDGYVTTFNAWWIIRLYPKNLFASFYGLNVHRQGSMIN